MEVSDNLQEILKIGEHDRDIECSIDRMECKKRAYKR